VEGRRGTRSDPTPVRTRRRFLEVWSGMTMTLFIVGWTAFMLLTLRFLKGGTDWDDD